MKYFLLTSILGSTLLFLTTTNLKTETEKPDKEQKQVVFQNPLDKILGETELGDSTIRKDNFKSILKLKASCLKDSSEYYNVYQLNDSIFLLQRKKFYIDNRRYSLFVKTKGEKIISVHPVIDYVVRSAIYLEDKIYCISDDYTEIASPWQPTYTVKISCMTTDFQEVWSTFSLTNKGLFFMGIQIESYDEKLIATIGIQREGSSTMCVENFSLLLTMNGEIIDVGGAPGSYSCGSTMVIGKNEIPNFFRKDIADL